MMQNLDVALIDEGRLGLMELIKFSIIIVASLPVLCIYPDPDVVARDDARRELFRRQAAERGVRGQNRC